MEDVACVLKCNSIIVHTLCCTRLHNFCANQVCGQHFIPCQISLFSLMCIQLLDDFPQISSAGSGLSPGLCTVPTVCRLHADWLSGRMTAQQERHAAGEDAAGAHSSHHHITHLDHHHYEHFRLQRWA